MSGRTGARVTIRHITVALDGSADSLAALDAAAALAAQVGAELEGLFVEDEDVLRLAELPCAHVTSTLLQCSEATDRARVELRLQHQARRARAHLEQRAGALRIAAQYRQVRGQVLSVVQEAAPGADMLSVSLAHGALGQGVSPAVAVQMALASGRPLLVVERQPQTGHGLLAVYDDTAAGPLALDLAADLAEAARQRLCVLVVGESAAVTDARSHEVHARLAERGLAHHLHCTNATPTVAILSALRRRRPALLVLGVDEAGAEQAEQIIASVHYPVLLVP